jgi:hypothetical protein
MASPIFGLRARSIAAASEGTIEKTVRGKEKFIRQASFSLAAPTFYNHAIPCIPSESKSNTPGRQYQ